MSNRTCAAAAFTASKFAAFVALISLCAFDFAPATERTAPAPSQVIEQSAPLQRMNLPSPSATGNATPLERQRAVAALDLSPAVFIENKGQWASEIRYGFDGKGTRVSFTDAGPIFQMTKSEGESGETSQAVFSATFVGGKSVQPVGLDQSPSTTNYFLGNDPSKWKDGVPSFEKVLYRGIYEGVDLCAWGKRSGLKYEFRVAPGASWDRIVVRFAGIDGLAIDGKGALHVKTPLGEIVDGAPVVYQEADGRRTEIAARYRLVDERSYGFEITGAVDPSLPLVIDPDLTWARYLGGYSTDYGYGIAADALGNCYVVGETSSWDFPTPGGLNAIKNGASDAFLAKVNAAGQVAWGTFLGGGAEDGGRGIAVDSSGNCYVTGWTRSEDFPTPGEFSIGYSGGDDAFVAKLTSSGHLAWGSYLGGTFPDRGDGIAVDASGNCYVTGFTASSDFPTPGGFCTTFDPTYDVFLAKMTSAGQLEWASFIGSSIDTDLEQRPAIAVDASGNCFLTGQTTGLGFPALGGFDSSFHGFTDAFVVKVTSSGQVAWASYLGGSYRDQGRGIAVDCLGDCYVAGSSGSSDFPNTGNFGTGWTNHYGAFVAKVTSSGQLAWVNCFAASCATGIAAGASGNLYVTGYTNSGNLPTAGGFDTSWNGGFDAFVAAATSSEQLLWSSYLGGSGADRATGIAADASGNCYVTGCTNSSDFPSPHSFDENLSGSNDAFVAKIWGGVLPPDPLSVATTALPAGVAGAEYHAALAAAGGVGPYEWSIVSGALPAQLSLTSSTGVIDGTAVIECASSFTVKVTDNQQKTATKALSIEVYPAALGDVNWLDITKFQVSLPASVGHDSFILKGAFNMWPGGPAPRTVTLTIDGWSLVVDAPSWKRAGATNVYTSRQDGVSCKMTWWANGTSKCLFQFTGSMQTLKGRLPSLPTLPVRLQVGDDFDETLLAGMTVTNTVAKLSSLGPRPLFHPEKFTSVRNHRLASHDAFALSGKVHLDRDLDPSADDVTVKIGPYEISLPAGTMALTKTGVVQYTGGTANGKMAFQLNNKTHALKVTATGVDMFSAARNMRISLSIANHPGADWDYSIFMPGTSGASAYRY